MNQQEKPVEQMSNEELEAIVLAALQGEQEDEDG